MINIPSVVVEVGIVPICDLKYIHVVKISCYLHLTNIDLASIIYSADSLNSWNAEGQTLINK